MGFWKTVPRGDWLDGFLAAALFAFALALRLPYLYLVPRFTDEMNESSVALQIALGEHSPLVGVIPYVGPLYPDLLALVLRLNLNPFVPRAFVTCLCALTIVATYALGRVLYGRAAGFVAAALMATSSTDLVVNSHIAYGNSITPLFSTLALICLIIARSRFSALQLALAGALLACAIQTHPAPVALVPGLLVWFLLPRAQWVWFRRVGLYAAAGVTLLTYSPVIATVAAQSKQFARAVETRSYAFTTDHSLPAYLANLQGLLVELLRMTGAIFRNYQTPAEYLIQPLALTYAVIVPLALIVAARRGRAILPLALGSAALLIPYFNRQYEAYPFFTRYLAFILPLIYVAVGGLFMAAVARARPPSLLLTGVVALAAFALVVAPLPPTFQFYEDQIRSGRSNALFLDIVQRVQANRGAEILVDRSLVAGEFPSGGNLLLSFQTWFEFAGRPFRNVDLQAAQLSDLCTAERSLLVAADAAAARLQASCALTRVTGTTIPTRPGRDDLTYSLFEIKAR